ncbi:MAG: hypothetical protein K9M51_02165 [Candidatus Gracilibacteria bacterium]|nr:hypothetical protein [Candidatus Gracilibacteria bacterium]
MKKEGTDFELVLGLAQQVSGTDLPEVTREALEKHQKRIEKVQKELGAVTQETKKSIDWIVEAAIMSDFDIPDSLLKEWEERGE